MNRMMICAAITALFCAAPMQAQQAPPAPQEHARFDFPFTVNGQEYVLTYEGTHDVMQQPDPAVKLVVFVHHGGSENPVTYFKHMKTALDAAAADSPGRNLPGTTMIIAPGMISEAHIKDNPKRYAGKNYPYWGGGWREGEPSRSKPQVSNFDLLDGMVMHIADRYPNVKAIVHAGHSAGGQLLSRYSFGTPVYDVLRARGIYVRYVIGNPSSMLYFDRQRPDLIAGKGFVDYRSRIPVLAEGECKDFNTYKYGLDGLVPYMTRRPVSAMLAAFRKRDVYLINGTADIDPMADGLDRDCPGLLQGRFRLERGQRYYEYLGHFFGPEIYKSKFLVLVTRRRARRRRDVQERGRQTAHLHRCRQRGEGDSRRGRKPSAREIHAGHSRRRWRARAGRIRRQAWTRERLSRRAERRAESGIPGADRRRFGGRSG